MRETIRGVWQDIRKKTRGLLVHWAISSTVIFACLCLYWVWPRGGASSLPEVLLAFLLVAILTPPVLLLVWLLLY